MTLTNYITFIWSRCLRQPPQTVQVTLQVRSKTTKTGLTETRPRCSADTRIAAALQPHSPHACVSTVFRLYFFECVRVCACVRVCVCVCVCVCECVCVCR